MPGRSGTRWTGLGRPGLGRPGPGRGAISSRGGPPTVSGRWSLLPPGEPDQTRRLHALAMTLLERHGIVIRGAVAAEHVPGGFGALYPVLRAMEEAGHCRRGYFVEGLGAAQFALPGAVDRMRAMSRPPAAAPDAAFWPTDAAGVQADADGRPADAAVWPADAAVWPGDAGGRPGDASGWPGDAGSRPGDAGGRPGDAGGRPGDAGGRPGDASGWPGAAPAAQVVVLAATDPASAYGAALPWPPRPEETPGSHRPGRKAGALVVLTDGELVLYVERGGRTLLSWTSDPAALAPAAAALAGAVRAGALGRLTVERADGATVYDSPLAQALEAAGFRPTPRGLRLRA